ncbi:MAG: helix-turn-helix domain-containing protein [Treponema sp.]|nr:helix-turn-helix domain-containing protein [Treponema sp.]
MKGTEIRRVLAKNIKFFRENRLWSQADLAANSEISVPFLSEIERGNKWPFPDTLGKIANALNVQVHDLFRDGGTPSNTERDFAGIVLKEMLIAQKTAVDIVTKQYFGSGAVF